MESKVLLISSLIILILFTLSSNAQEMDAIPEKLPNHTQSEYPFIYNLTIALREDTSRKVFILLALNNDTYGLNSTVSLIEIVEGMELQQFETKELIQAGSLLGLNWNNSYHGLSNISWGDFLRNKMTPVFGTTLKQVCSNLTSENVTQILNILNISRAIFTDSCVFGNEEDVIEVALSGNYSKNNVENIFKILSFERFLDIISFKNAFSNIRLVLDENSLRHIFNELYVNTYKMEQILDHFGISGMPFIRSPSLMENLERLSHYFNPNITLGVGVTPNRVLTSSVAKMFHMHKKNETGFLLQYTSIMATPIFDIDSSPSILKYQLPQHGKKHILLTSDKNITGHIGVLEKYYGQNLTFCKYISANSSGPQVEVVKQINITKVNDSIMYMTIPKQNDTVFALGSSLICNRTLLGIAIAEEQSVIRFQTFLSDSLLGPIIVSAAVNLHCTLGILLVSSLFAKLLR